MPDQIEIFGVTKNIVGSAFESEIYLTPDVIITEVLVKKVKVLGLAM